MSKKILIYIILSAIIQFINAQGTVRGKVTDQSGEELIGATIIIKNTTIGTSTDLNGNYSIKITSKNPCVLVVSYISYKSVEKTVNPQNGQIVVQNIILQNDNKVIDEVEVVHKADKSTDDYVSLKAKGSALSVSFISKETISKTGDSQVDDAMKRVTGVSTYNGFISVRGLADRYIKTTINGSSIPTLDPLTNNIKLDLIPTSLIDNIIINKTMSPDLPGDWAGSYVSVHTKDYPEKLMLSLKTTFGYNPNSSFREVTTSESSSTDWLGYDNSLRDIDHSTYSPTVEPGKINQYDVIVELGYNEYLESIGISNINTFNSDKNFYYLVLVEAGYLDASLVDDATAIEQADKSFRSSESYQSVYNKLLEEHNSEAKDFGKSLDDQWLTQTKMNYLDYSQDLTFGNQSKLFGKTLGYIMGLRYATSTVFESDYYREKGAYTPISSNGGYGFTLYEKDWGRNTVETNQWGGLVNLSYQLSPYNSFSLVFMPSFNGKATSKYYEGELNKDVEYKSIFKNEQDYEERQLLVYQYQSTHIFPSSLTKINLNVSYTDGQNNNLDSKSYTYSIDTNETRISYEDKYQPQRVFRYLDENVLDSRADIEIPLTQNSGLNKKIKAGVAYKYHIRESEQYLYSISGLFPKTDPIINSDSSLNYITSKETFEKGDNYYESLDFFTNNTKGEQEVSAIYAMTDLNITKKLRISGGLRVEYSKIHSDLSEFYESGISANLPIRNVSIGEGEYLCNPTKREDTYLLPSINLVYKIVTTDKIAMVSRGSYSKSIARPSLRELSATKSLDFSLDSYLTGNPDLKDVEIDNIDLRLETFFKNKDNLAISLFYKSITNHIELTVNSWENAVGKGSVMGVEFEGRKSIFKNLELLGNVSFMKSEILMEDPYSKEMISRDMFGQSPYLVNVTLSYLSEKTKFNASLSYNVQGEKLVMVTNGILDPDIYELPRHKFDFKVSKKIGKHFSVELKIKDILNTKTIWKYIDEDDESLNSIYKQSSSGSVYSFSIGYSL